MKNPIVISLMLVLFYAALFAVLAFVAGTWDLPFVLAVMVLQALATMSSLKWIDPDLIEERRKPKGKDEDPLAAGIISVLFLGCFLVAAMDLGRWHYSSIPVWLEIVALILQTIGWGGFCWMMVVNRFFSAAIRLQPDRQQRVVCEGPYRYVRHPGYAFASLCFLTVGIAMGSWLAEIPSLLIILDLVYRTFLEEKILSAGLEGYKEYMQKVRFRWVPGVW